MSVKNTIYYEIRPSATSATLRPLTVAIGSKVARVATGQNENMPGLKSTVERPIIMEYDGEVSHYMKINTKASDDYFLHHGRHAREGPEGDIEQTMTLYRAHQKDWNPQKPEVLPVYLLNAKTNSH